MVKVVYDSESRGRALLDICVSNTIRPAQSGTSFGQFLWVLHPGSLPVEL